MISKTTIAAALISLSTLAAVPAQAGGVSIEFGGGPGWSDHGQGHHVRRHRLSPKQVRWIMRERGYRQIHFFDNQGPVYQLRARKHGDTYFLVVSARSGEILSRHRI